MVSKCPKCTHDNPDDASFCEECGFKLSYTAAVAETPSKPIPEPQKSKYSLIFEKGVIEAEDSRDFSRTDFSQYYELETLQYITRKKEGRTHFKITNENDKFYIQDDGSSNGTLLNGVEIRGSGKKEIKDNDKILVGTVIELQFKIRK